MKISVEKPQSRVGELGRQLGGKIAGLVVAAAGGILLVEYGPPVLGAILLGFFTLVAVTLLLLNASPIRHWFSGRERSMAWAMTVLTYALVLSGVGFRFSLNQLSPSLQAQLKEFEPEVARLEGVVLTEPRVFPAEDEPGAEPTARFELRVTGWAAEDARPAPMFPKLRVYWRGAAPAYGEVVRIRGSLRSLEPPDNPVGWDWREILARRGIYGQLTAYYARDCRRTGESRGNPARRLGFQLRDDLARVLQRGIAEDAVATSVILGLVLGIRDFADPELSEMFRETGTLHLFAVSGLHVGMVLLYLWLILGLLRVPARQRALVLIPILLLYALVTGLRPPVVRAGVMASLVLLGVICQRRPMLMRNLAAAALILLAVDPGQLFQPGFQFSFLVLTAIVFLAPRIMRLLEPLQPREPLLPAKLLTWPQRLHHQATLYAAGLLSTSLAAFMGSIPLAIWHFHMLSPVGVVLNFAAIPLAFAIVGLGIFSLLTGWIPLLSVLLNNANLLATHTLLALISLGWHLPGSHLYLPPPGSRPGLGEVRVVVFSYRDSSSAILLQTREQNWLVDCGNARTYPWVLEPALNYQGVRRLDGLILTHGDSRHIGGAGAVLDEFEPRQIWLPAGSSRSSTLRGFREKLRERQRVGHALTAGKILPLGEGVTLEVLFPPPDDTERWADDRAAVLLLRNGPPNPRAVMLMGDAGFMTEQVLREAYPDLRVDTIIYSGHLFDHFATVPFLEQLQPGMIYHGGPPVTYPRESMLKRVAGLNDSRFHDTSRGGAVIFTLGRDP
jgi:ComEC/Rec2-related protein